MKGGRGISPEGPCASRDRPRGRGEREGEVGGGYQSGRKFFVEGRPLGEFDGESDGNSEKTYRKKGQKREAGGFKVSHYARSGGHEEKEREWGGRWEMWKNRKWTVMSGTEQKGYFLLTSDST